MHLSMSIKFPPKSSGKPRVRWIPGVGGGGAFPWDKAAGA
jgi:hypothetical protein